MMAPNKTRPRSCTAKMKTFFPNNAVEYFRPYYDYYQPEAYVPSPDTYIEKDSSINEHIEQMRFRRRQRRCCRRAARDRRRTVSAIYGLGRSGGLPVAACS